MRATLGWFGSLAVTGVLTGCSLAQVDVTVEDLCFTQHEVTIPGAPAGAPADLATGFTFADVELFQQLAAIEGEVWLTSASVRTSATTALAGIRAAHATLYSLDLPRLDAFDCDGDCTTATGEIMLAPDADGDILRYLTSPSLGVSLQLAGALPAQDWSVSVEMCVDGTLSRDFEP